MSRKIVDVVIEDGAGHFVIVYANAKMQDIITEIEGVAGVTLMETTEYWVKLDPRYDREQTKREIMDILTRASLDTAS